MQGLIETLMQSELAKPFLEPVSIIEAPTYYETIKKPMDLGTLYNILLTRKGFSPASFERNLRLIFKNAREYNGETDQVASNHSCENPNEVNYCFWQISKAANALERMFERKWAKIIPLLESERISLDNAHRDRLKEAEVAGLKSDQHLDHSTTTSEQLRPGSLKRSRGLGQESEKKSSPADVITPSKRSRIKSEVKIRECSLQSDTNNVQGSKAFDDQESNSRRPKKSPKGDGDQKLISVGSVDQSHSVGAGSRSLEIGRGPRRSKGEAVEQPDNGLSDSLVGAHVGETADVSLEHVVMGDCLSMLERLRTSRGGHYFAEPVDAEALGLHDYHEIVTEPLDFSTIRERLLSGLYCHRRKGKGSQAFSEKDGIKMRESFGRDVRKVLDNAMLYNPESDRVYKAAASILEFFNNAWNFSKDSISDGSIMDGNSDTGKEKGSLVSGKKSIPKWYRRCLDELSELMEKNMPDAAFLIKPKERKPLGVKDLVKDAEQLINLTSIKDALQDGKISSYDEFTRMVSSNLMFFNNNKTKV